MEGTTIPRSGSGVFSLTPGYAATPNTVISSGAQHNTVLDDLAADANVARPIVAGGTGANNAVQALANLNGQTLLNYSPVDRAGTLATTGLLPIGVGLNYTNTPGAIWNEVVTGTAAVAANAVLFMPQGSGLITITSQSTGEIGYFIAGVGQTKLIIQIGTLFADTLTASKLCLVYATPEQAYYVKNNTASAHTLTIDACRTRPSA